MPCRVEICVIFARNLVTRRGIAGSLMNGRGRILTRSTEVTLVMPIPAPQFRVTTAGKRVIFHRNVEENGETREGEGMEVLEADKWQIRPNLWQQYRKFGRNWYQRRFFPRELR